MPATRSGAVAAWIGAAFEAAIGVVDDGAGMAHDFVIGLGHINRTDKYLTGHGCRRGA